MYFWICICTILWDCKNVRMVKKKLICLLNAFDVYHVAYRTIPSKLSEKSAVIFLYRRLLYDIYEDIHFKCPHCFWLLRRSVFIIFFYLFFIFSFRLLSHSLCFSLSTFRTVHTKFAMQFSMAFIRYATKEEKFQNKWNGVAHISQFHLFTSLGQ